MAPRRGRSDLPEISEQRAAERYTRQWFEVYDWAVTVMQGIAGFEWAQIPEHATRMARMKAIVRNQYDGERAYKKAVPIIELEDWLAHAAPGMEAGGRRRVVIRIFCWEIDRRNEDAFNETWIRVADDLSAHASRSRALRWARGYDTDLNEGRASRELRMTAIEIAWWTRNQRATLL